MIQTIETINKIKQIKNALDGKIANKIRMCGALLLKQLLHNYKLCPKLNQKSQIQESSHKNYAT